MWDRGGWNLSMILQVHRIDLDLKQIRGRDAEIMTF